VSQALCVLKTLTLRGDKSLLGEGKFEVGLKDKELARQGRKGREGATDKGNSMRTGMGSCQEDLV
jgi:hypothetical protein